MLRTVLLIASLIIVAVPGLVRANGPEVGFDAGSIIPLVSRDVQLVREWVDLYAPFDDDRSRWRAECSYLLANRSKRPRTLNMSFLAGIRAGSLERPDMLPARDDEFRVRVNFQPTPTARVPIDRARWEQFGMLLPDSLPVWQVHIPAGDSVVVQMEYFVESSGGGEGDWRSRGLRYFARPASLWAGRIREATFEVHLGETLAALLRCRPSVSPEGCPELKLVPEEVQWTRDGFAWRRTDWEPDTDFAFDLSWESPGSNP